MNSGVAGQPVTLPVTSLWPPCCWQIDAALLSSGILSAPSLPEPSSITATPPPPARSPGMSPGQALAMLAPPLAPPAAFKVERAGGLPQAWLWVSWPYTQTRVSHPSFQPLLPPLSAMQPWPLGILYHEPLLLPAPRAITAVNLGSPLGGQVPCPRKWALVNKFSHPRATLLP